MLKKFIRRCIDFVVEPFVNGVLAGKVSRNLNRIITDSAEQQTFKRLDEIGAVDKGMQILLSLKYKEMLRNGDPLPSFDEVQFRAFSQTGEDGLLLFIFSLIGTTNEKCVEVAAGNGFECNTANLIINHGWHGLLFDGDEKNIKMGQQFYSNCSDTRIWPPTLVHDWITSETINDLIRKNYVEGEVDLLSLDLDGNDYWIWRAIDCIDPRVVIVEFDNEWDSDMCVTQRYDPNYVWDSRSAAGASLAAFVKLGRQKGYRLVGSQRLCFNAVFLRNDVGQDIFPEVPIDDCLDHPLPQYRIAMRNAELKTKSLNGKWVKV